MTPVNLRDAMKALHRQMYSEDRATAYYDARDASLRALAQEQGYNFIVEYFQQQANQAMNYLANPTTSNEMIKFHQAMYSSATEFLDLLDDVPALDEEIEVTPSEYI